MVYGYARVSSVGQIDGNSFEDQEKLIKSNYPDAEIHLEQGSGAKERKVLNEIMDKSVSGDTIVVTKLDRFCRSTALGLEYIERMRAKGVKIHILNMGLIENTPIGKLIVTNLLAFAEFERAMILERTQSGKTIARQKEGYQEGRPKTVSIPEEVKQKVDSGEMTVAAACRELGISRSTWYNEMRAARAE